MNAGRSDASWRSRFCHPITLLAYGALGVVLCWSRVNGLDRSFWHDEILTVSLFVREGLGEILAGTYIPNNHVLFSVVLWLTDVLAGESEISFRMWSVVPFIVGTAVVTVYLHRVVNSRSAVLFLMFSTLSPLLLDLSRQARGYGIAWLAMSVLLVSAWEAQRSNRTWALVGAFVAGVVGTLTLPIFAPVFLGTAVVLLSNPALRRRAALASAPAMAVTSAWYAPSATDLVRNAGQEFGEPIPWYGLPTALIEHVLIPGMMWMEGPTLTQGFERLPLVVGLALVLLSSPLLRERTIALTLGTGALLTVTIVWATRLYLSPRFLSFLLVPLFVFLATACAALLHVRASRHVVRLSFLGAVAVVGLSVSAFLAAAPDIVGLPREAHRHAIETARARSSATTPVFAYTFRPKDLQFYDRLVRPIRASEAERRVCNAPSRVVLITQPYGVPDLPLSCYRRPGADRQTLRQYSSGNEINVWFIPRQPPP